MTRRTSTSAPTDRWGVLSPHDIWSRSSPAPVPSSSSNIPMQPTTPAPRVPSRLGVIRGDEVSASSSSSVVSGGLSRDLLFSALPQEPSAHGGVEEILRELRGLKDSLHESQVNILR